MLALEKYHTNLDLLVTLLILFQRGIFFVFHRRPPFLATTTNDGLADVKGTWHWISNSGEPFLRTQETSKSGTNPLNL